MGSVSRARSAASPSRHLCDDLYRLPEFSIHGDELVFMQHAHIARRVLEVGKWLVLGRSLPVPVSLHPRGGAPGVPAVTGRRSPPQEAGFCLGLVCRLSWRQSDSNCRSLSLDSRRRWGRRSQGTSGSNPPPSSGANPRSLSSRRDALPGIVYLAAVQLCVTTAASSQARYSESVANGSKL
jgi:hypothetical protein